MSKRYLDEVNSLNSLPHVDKRIIKQFITRITQGKLVREENESDHLCSFFVPIHRQSNSVYLGYHIKAKSWIPPGGHINPGETPRQAVYREFFEELNYQLTDELVELFDLTIKPIINNPRHNCKVHYDFWYAVALKDRIDFAFTKDEFYEAKWMGFTEAKRKMKLQDYRFVIEKLFISSLYAKHRR